MPLAIRITTFITTKAPRPITTTAASMVAATMAADFPVGASTVVGITADIIDTR